MKKLNLKLLCTFSLVFSCCMVTLSAHENQNSVEKLESVVIAQEGNKKVEYSEELGGYLLTNITVSEVQDAFVSSNGFTPVETGNDVKVADSEFEKRAATALLSKGLSPSAASTYVKEYELSNSCTGVTRGSTVNIYYTTRLNMKTVTINGKNYAQFVSVQANATNWLKSSSYTFAAGTTTPITSIKNGGATLQIEHWVQLETTSTYSASAGISVGWFSTGVCSGSTYYYRNSPVYKTTKYDLPIKDFVS